jgi:hypothetical protein
MRRGRHALDLVVRLGAGAFIQGGVVRLRLSEGNPVSKRAEYTSLIGVNNGSQAGDNHEGQSAHYHGCDNTVRSRMRSFGEREQGFSSRLSRRILMRRRVSIWKGEILAFAASYAAVVSAMIESAEVSDDAHP